MPAIHGSVEFFESEAYGWMLPFDVSIPGLSVSEDFTGKCYGAAIS